MSLTQEIREALDLRNLKLPAGLKILDIKVEVNRKSPNSLSDLSRKVIP